MATAPGSPLVSSSRCPSEDSAEYYRIKEAVNAELKRYFKPEFLNRLDDVIVFHQLNKPQASPSALPTVPLPPPRITVDYAAGVAAVYGFCGLQVFEIAEIMLEEIARRLQEKDITLTVTQDFKDHTSA
jgi:ATP-dependent Clp protease ATP-binding subunit ClpC